MRQEGESRKLISTSRVEEPKKASSGGILVGPRYVGITMQRAFLYSQTASASLT